MASATPRDGLRLDAHQNAHRSVPKRAGVSWPFPIDRRLDQLVDLAAHVGANTSKHGLAATLVAAADRRTAHLGVAT